MKGEKVEGKKVLKSEVGRGQKRGLELERGHQSSCKGREETSKWYRVWRRG